MAQPKILNNATEEGKKRWYFYATLTAILLAIIVATVIWLGFITEEDFDRWVLLVGITIPAFIGLLGQIRALLHPEKQHDAPVGITDRDQVM